MYYDYFNHNAYRGAAKGKNITVPAELHQIPLFIRGGSIVPTRERPRRSSPLMKYDPFTLRVALSNEGEVYHREVEATSLVLGGVEAARQQLKTVTCGYTLSST